MTKAMIVQKRETFTAIRVDMEGQGIYYCVYSIDPHQSKFYNEVEFARLFKEVE